MALRIVCVKSGTKYGSEYVLNLQDMVKRNLPDGLPGTFICFTDDPVPGVACAPLPAEGLEGWYNKLALFQDDLFPKGDRIVYLDLDTVITGPLDDIVNYRGDFAILRDAYRPEGLQSAFMCWESGKQGHIWDGYDMVGRPTLQNGDQEWIEKTVPAPDILQQIFPGKFASYKKEARFGIPKGCSVVFFHGEPRPHEAGGWVESVWKVGAGTPGELFLQQNVDSHIVSRNIRYAENIKNAHWLTGVKPHNKVALICAGGPSLLEELPSLRLHVVNGGHVISCNGAARALSREGIRSHGHVIVDARPENEVFLTGIDENTVCFYASQCDPRVLSRAAERLVLWHPAIDGISEIISKTIDRTLIGGGTTCGMKAVVLAWILGYREIHLYGFDSSYRGNEHHAYPQSLNDQDRILDVNFNGVDYKCAPWMIQQAEDFQTFAPQLMDQGVALAVHGSGLIPHIAREFANGKFPFSSADMRCHAILERIGHIPEPKVAEVGVFAGDLSSRLLARHKGLHLTMIDSWGEGFGADYLASSDYHANMHRVDHEMFYEQARNSVRAFADRAVIHRGRSDQMCARIPDRTLDLAFIDADHTYDGCKADLAAYYPKVKPGGIIAGHDYANDDWEFGPTVKRAVDEFITAHGLTLELGENWTWFATKPMEQ